MRRPAGTDPSPILGEMSESPVKALPFTIALTGGIGSGKSTVERLFAERGVTIVDTDRIAHELTGPGGEAMPAIAAEFGHEVLALDGRLDRDRMREIVFADPDARRRLEAILHPMIRAVSTQRLAASTGPYAILVIPLLVESGRPRERAARVLVVDCPRETQIERVMHRNGLPRARVESILAAQASREQRLEAADDVIVNDTTPDALVPAVEALHRRYLEMAARN